ncbi:MAG: hypothetical protein H7A51_09270 [Akkermansiaceae bacterium]|nr:hypothetical protein [Akkermansiaceae bacterium]
MTHYLHSFLLALAFLVFSRVVRNRRLLWGGMLAVLAGVHLLHIHDAPFARMVVICSVLLICMKGIVYVEWGRRLPWSRWFMFTFLWFGMEPTPFAAGRRKLRWKKDAVTGLACLATGLLLSVLVAHYRIDSILVMFVPLSLAFHFGVLRLLTAFWRMRGIAVRPLFRNPLVSRGVADFWSMRWNLSFSQMMARTVQRPLTPHIGKRAALFAVFLVSGLLHELAITVPVQSGYGLPTLYFTLHGVLVLIENDRWPLWLRRAIVLVMVAAPLPVLFPAEFSRQVIELTLSYLRL